MEIDKRWLADGALVTLCRFRLARALRGGVDHRDRSRPDTLGKARRAAAPAPVTLGFDPALLDAQARASKNPLPDGLTRSMFGQEGDKPNIFGMMTTSLSIMQDRLDSLAPGRRPADVTSRRKAATSACSISSARRRRSRRERPPWSASGRTSGCAGGHGPRHQSMNAARLSHPSSRAKRATRKSGANRA